MHLLLFPQGKTKEGVKRDFFATQVRKEAVVYLEGRRITNSNTLSARNRHLLLAQGMLPWKEQLVSWFLAGIGLIFTRSWEGIQPGEPMSN